jgi:hypothetical protein
MRKLALALAFGMMLSGGFGTPAHVAAASGQDKVVIVVGAVQGTTSSYRADGDNAAAVFAKYTSNIVKVYSPNATWANVQAAAVGASVLVYIGHGSGYPNPYVGHLQPNGDDGMGLNYSAGSYARSDSYTQYYGENYMAQLGLAPNAVVLLWHLCYASGDNEWGRGVPTLATAQTRVDGYASGFLRGNARAVIADGVGNIGPYIDSIFTTHETIDTVWRSAPNFHNNVTSWESSRNPGFISSIDPGNPAPDGDPYYRSMVVAPGLTTDDVGGKVITYGATTFVSISPARLLDTRTGNGLPGKLAANKPGAFKVAGRDGIPSNATAVTGNVTVANPTAGWAVYIGPVAMVAPFTSTVNFGKGETKGNSLTIALGSDGTLSATYMAGAGNTTDLVFDATGYFVPITTGARYHPLAPTRLVDTRSANGLPKSLVANKPATFQVTGRAGIPSNAVAVTGNVTVVNSTNGWAVYLGPTPQAAPTTSTINFTTAQVKGNSLTVALGTNGSLSATFISTDGNTTDLVFDVTGYYSVGTTGDRFTPLTPWRLLDTRTGNGLTGKFSANVPRSFQIGGRAGIPGSAAGVTGNITVVNQTYSWAVFLGPNATASPSTSTINFLKGEVAGNGLAVALGSSGTLSATYMSVGGNTTDVVIDVTGYFAP